MKLQRTYAASYVRKEALIRQAKSQPCVDCLAAGLPGLWPVEAMQLDHLPQYEKRMKLSKQGAGDRRDPARHPDFVLFSVAEVIEELRHCEPVCANHHHIRTSQRARRGFRQEQAGQGVLTETARGAR